MRIRLAVALALLAAGLLLVTCSPATDNGEPQPPEIAYGQDMCDACGMIIDAPKFAAATVLKNGEARKFDDIGDMLAFHMDHPDQQVQARFVHDYNTGKWIRAEKAFYVVSPSIASPMGHGFAAFGDKAAAAEFARRLGVDVLDFDQARLAAHVEVHG